MTGVAAIARMFPGVPAEDHLERLAPLVGEWDVEAVFREENFPGPAPQDARGVARLDVVEIADGLWTLKRTEADFTPLDFAQRFTGERHGDRIDGRWFMRSPVVVGRRGARRPRS